MNKELSIGVIGCGGRGGLADFANLPGKSRLVAGADIYADMRQKFEERQKTKFDREVRTYSDYREMAEKEELDGVIIASPDFLHEEHAVYCLERGIPVYLEKPLALSIGSADRILEAAYCNRIKLVIGHNMRYMAFVRKMREIIEAGTIGEVRAVWCRHFVSYGGDAYFRDWHAVKKYCNTMLLQKGAHDIDVIHYLAGAYTAAVSGIGNLSVYDKVPRRPAGEERVEGGIGTVWKGSHWPPLEQKDFYPEVELEDLNMINMRLTNGVLASYEQCFYTPDSCRNYTVIGTRGRLENYGDYAPSSEIQVWTRRVDRFRLEGDITYRVDASDGTHGGADPLIIESFIDALLGKYEVLSSPQAARYSIAAGCCGAESIRGEGALVALTKLPEHLESWDFARAEVKK